MLVKGVSEGKDGGDGGEYEGIFKVIIFLFLCYILGIAVALGHFFHLYFILHFFQYPIYPALFNINK